MAIYLATGQSGHLVKTLPLLCHEDRITLPNMHIKDLSIPLSLVAIALSISLASVLPISEAAPAVAAAQKIDCRFVDCGQPYCRVDCAAVMKPRICCPVCSC